VAVGEAIMEGSGVADMADVDRARHAQLAQELEEHRRRYYGDDAASISDAEFDARMRELEAIEER
jgi:DNA ligase (NAD+)